MTSCACCANMWYMCCFLVSSTGEILLKNAISMFYLEKKCKPKLSTFNLFYKICKNSRRILSLTHFSHVSSLIEIKSEKAYEEQNSPYRRENIVCEIEALSHTFLKRVCTSFSFRRLH